MSLREKLKKETLEYHKALEEQYPFSELMTSKSTKVFYDALKCFKLTFYPLVKKKKETHLFYKEVFKSFEKFPVFSDDFFMEPSSEEKLIHLEYLFLGSRMGNEILLKKSLSLKDFRYKQYFEAPLDLSLWKNFLERLESIQNDLIQDEIVQSAIKGFVELRNYGRLLEENRVN